MSAGTNPRSLFFVTWSVLLLLHFVDMDSQLMWSKCEATSSWTSFIVAGWVRVVPSWVRKGVVRSSTPQSHGAFVKKSTSSSSKGLKYNPEKLKELLYWSSRSLTTVSATWKEQNEGNQIDPFLRPIWSLLCSISVANETASLSIRGRPTLWHILPQVNRCGAARFLAWTKNTPKKQKSVL